MEMDDVTGMHFMKKA